MMWPPDKQSTPLSELPEPGAVRYEVSEQTRVEFPLTLDVTDTEAFEHVQQRYLALAHSLGRPNDVKTRAQGILNRACFLLHWAALEVFLRSTIEELIALHPSILALHRRAKKTEVTYEELFKMSSSFSSVGDLLNGLIEVEFERMEAGGESVHGLINFLKKGLTFKRDSYKTWYVLKGCKQFTQYNDLVELKEVRNALLHDGGTPPELLGRLSSSTTT